VITTGNTDDLVFTSVALDGLTVEGPVIMGKTGINSVTGEPAKTYVNFGSNSRVLGCLNFAASATIVSADLEKTQVRHASSFGQEIALVNGQSQKY
jgi:hypothetical protein